VSITFWLGHPLSRGAPPPPISRRLCTCKKPEEESCSVDRAQPNRSRAKKEREPLKDTCPRILFWDRQTPTHPLSFLPDLSGVPQDGRFVPHRLERPGLPTSDKSSAFFSSRWPQMHTRRPHLKPPIPRASRFPDWKDNLREYSDG